MFQINDDSSIYLTRGDALFFSVSAEDENGEAYVFRAGDVLRMMVYAKKDCTDVLLQKEFPVEDDTENIAIFLSKEETRIGDVISKPRDCWYEIALNPYTDPQTIIGYDEDGAKIFRLFPEGEEIKEETDPEDIPVVDTDLDLTSERPVQNQAIAREISELNSRMDIVNAQFFAMTQLPNGSTKGDAELQDIRVAYNGKVHKTAGDAVRAQIRELRRQFEEPITEQVTNWLDEHPEATTTVQDRSLTADKLAIGTLGWVTPQMFGAAADGVTDDTAAIQAAIDNNVNVLLPQGTYAIYGTIYLDGSRTLMMQNMAYLKKPSDCANTDPVVHIKGNYNSLIGCGQANSRITSYVPTPYGVLLIGDKGMDAVPEDTLYNTIKDIAVIGHAEGGNTTGEPSRAIYICCADGLNKACYFNLMQNLCIEKANDGLMMEGYANANIIENLQFRHVGNSKLLDGAAIHLKNSNGKYPLENTITNAFHHQSSNAVTLFLDGMIIYNAIKNIISEQMGSNAICLKATEACDGNDISIIDNTNGGNDISSEFMRANTLHTRRNIYTRSLTVAYQNIRNEGYTEKRTGFAVTPCTDGKTYKLFTVDTQKLMSNQSLVVDIYVGFKGAGGNALYGVYGKATYLIMSDASYKPTVKRIALISSQSVFCEPIISGNTVTFAAAVRSITGSMTNVAIHCDYSIRGLNNSYEVTRHTTPELVSGATKITARALQTTENGNTESRPTSGLVKGQMYFDTTLGRPIWYNGSGWVNSSGQSV